MPHTSHEDALSSAATQDLADTLEQPLQLVRLHLARIRAHVMFWRSSRPFTAKDRARHLHHLAVKVKGLRKRAQEFQTLLQEIERADLWAIFQALDDDRTRVAVERLRDIAIELKLLDAPLSPLIAEMQSPGWGTRPNDNMRSVESDILVADLVDLFQKSHSRIPTCSSVGSDGAHHSGEFPALARTYLQALALNPSPSSGKSPVSLDRHVQRLAARYKRTQAKYRDHYRSRPTHK